MSDKQPSVNFEKNHIVFPEGKAVTNAATLKKLFEKKVFDSLIEQFRKKFNLTATVNEIRDAFINQPSTGLEGISVIKDFVPYIESFDIMTTDFSGKITPLLGVSDTIWKEFLDFRNFPEKNKVSKGILRSINDVFKIYESKKTLVESFSGSTNQLSELDLDKLRSMIFNQTNSLSVLIEVLKQCDPKYKKQILQLSPKKWTKYDLQDFVSYNRKFNEYFSGLDMATISSLKDSEGHTILMKIIILNDNNLLSDYIKQFNKLKLSVNLDAIKETFFLVLEKAKSDEAFILEDAVGYNFLKTGLFHEFCQNILDEDKSFLNDFPNLIQPLSDIFEIISK